MNVAAMTRTLRGTAERTMDHRCTIERLTSVPDGGGGTTETWQPLAADVHCYAWDDARRAGEVDQAGKVTVVRDRRVLLPLGIDVTEADRIASVVDRTGGEVFDGPMAITAVTRRATHLDLFVEVTA